MVVLGADLHKRSHTVVVIDATGRQLAEKTIAATDAGHLELRRWAAQWPERTWGLEDCRHLSRRLDAELVRAGESVVRVSPKLMAGARRSGREPGKSDPIDALAVARAVLREPGLPVASLDGPDRVVRLLVDHREDLVMGYVVLRGAIETVLYTFTALGWLLLIALGTQPDAAPLAGFVRTGVAVTWDQLVAIPFALGALMFYVLLFRSRLVPRWLSAWGLMGAVLYIVPPLGSMFGLSLGLLMAPLAVQEMVMAVWLIAKGFNPREVASAPAIATAPAIEPSRAAAGAL